jgi:hypothetical protein
MGNKHDSIDMMNLVQTIQAKEGKKYCPMIERDSFRPVLRVEERNSTHPRMKRSVRVAWKAQHTLEIAVWFDYGRTMSMKDSSSWVQAHVLNKQEEYAFLFLTMPEDYTTPNHLFGKWEVDMLPIGRIDPMLSYSIVGRYVFNCNGMTHDEVTDIIIQAMRLVTEPKDKTYLDMITNTKHIGAWDYNDTGFRVK